GGGVRLRLQGHGVRGEHLLDRTRIARGGSARLTGGGADGYQWGTVREQPAEGRHEPALFEVLDAGLEARRPGAEEFLELFRGQGKSLNWMRVVMERPLD